MPAAVASAEGLLALLDEPSDDLKKYALTRLDGIVNDHWFQISSSISSVEALYEDDSFTARNLAALVASKVTRHTTLCLTNADLGFVPQLRVRTRP